MNPLTLVAGAQILGGIFGMSSASRAKKEAQKGYKAELAAFGIQTELAELGYQAATIAADAAAMAGQAQAYELESQSMLVKYEAALAVSETLEEARGVASDNRKFLGMQTLAFTKSGFDLAGTPLMVLNDTAVEGAKVVKSYTDRAVAIAKKGRLESASLSDSAGNARRSGLAQRASILAQGAMAKVSSIFDAQFGVARAKANLGTTKANANASLFSSFSNIVEGYAKIK